MKNSKATDKKKLDVYKEKISISKWVKLSEESIKQTK